MFLKSARNSLAIPLLPSLLPAEALAQTCRTPPARFFMIGSQWSPTPELYLGGLLAANQLTRVSDRVATRSLTGLTNISDVFGSEFNSFVSKMLILRGLDGLGPAAQEQHYYGTATAGIPATWNGSSDDINARLAAQGVGVDHDLSPIMNGSSIDVVLNNNLRMNPGRLPLMSLVPNQTNGHSVYDWGNQTNGSYTRQGNNQSTWRGVILRDNDGSTQTLYNRFINQLSGGSVVVAPSTSAADQDVIQGVFEDYRAVRQNPRLSSVDRSNLEAFMALISDLMRSLAGMAPPPPVAVQCRAPSANRPAENNSFNAFKNRVDIVIAAMACDLVRVANVQNSTIENALVGGQQAGIHDYHHSLSGNGSSLGNTFLRDAFRNMWIEAGRRTAYVLSTMNSFTEQGGTLLDNSLVYWFTQHGMAQNTGTSHTDGDRSVMIAGGGGGALRTGFYVDYRHATERYVNGDVYRTPGVPGIPINSLLTTFANLYAIPTSEYEMNNEPGFGTYRNGQTGGWLYALSKYSANYRTMILNTRRESLPWIVNRNICS